MVVSQYISPHLCIICSQVPEGWRNDSLICPEVESRGRGQTTFPLFACLFCAVMIVSSLSCLLQHNNLVLPLAWPHLLNPYIDTLLEGKNLTFSFPKDSEVNSLPGPHPIWIGSFLCRSRAHALPWRIVAGWDGGGFSITIFMWVVLMWCAKVWDGHLKQGGA